MSGEACATFTERLGVLDALDHTPDFVELDDLSMDVERRDAGADRYPVGNSVDTAKVQTERDTVKRTIVRLEAVVESEEVVQACWCEAPWV